jgi:hypothetical protein
VVVVVVEVMVMSGAVLVRSGLGAVGSSLFHGVPLYVRAMEDR